MSDCIGEIKYDESGVRDDCDGDAQLQVFIKNDNGSHKYGFNLSAVNPASHQWLFEVTQSQMKEIHARGVEQGKREVRNHLKAAMGGQI